MILRGRLGVGVEIGDRDGAGRAVRRMVAGSGEVALVTMSRSAIGVGCPRTTGVLHQATAPAEAGVGLTSTTRATVVSVPATVGITTIVTVAEAPIARLLQGGTSRRCSRIDDALRLAGGDDRRAGRRSEVRTTPDAGPGSGASDGSARRSAPGRSSRSGGWPPGPPPARRGRT